MQTWKLRIGLALLCAAMLWPQLMGAENPVLRESNRLHEARYQEAARHLRGGNPEQRARAAIYLGSTRNPRYLRPLGRSLLDGLEAGTPYLDFPENQPYIKSQIAWAVGRIGHHKGIPYLLEALEKTFAILEAQAVQIDQRQQLAEQRYQAALEEARRNNTPISMAPIRDVVLQPEKPGPFLRDRTHEIPYSPDIYWSLSNDFKRLMAFDPTSGDHRVMMQGYNYANLAFYVFDSIGEIYYRPENNALVTNEAVDAVALHLTHRFPFVRSAAALCLAKMGTPEALAALKETYETEENPEVRTKISYAILIVNRSEYDHYLGILNALGEEDDAVRYAAAVAMRDLSMGSAINALRSAYEIEHLDLVRGVLSKAIENAERDLVTPAAR